MSIKAFHVLFIALAAAVSFGFGAWSLREDAHTALGVLSLAMGAALLAYGAAFLKKMKAHHIS